VFVQIGLVPNTEWLKGTVELSKFGEIVIDAKGHTNVPGVFAAGDCTTVPYKQIVIAAGAGATAALSAFDHLIRALGQRHRRKAIRVHHHGRRSLRKQLFTTIIEH
jgi:alkyl hydroperoxide reductase subunit F